MSLQGLMRLEVWKKAKDFALSVYRDVLLVLPREEKWTLDGQIQRAVQSIPANIAEGYGRYYYQDNVRFCYIARGSLEETLNYIQIIHELNILPKETYEKIVKDGEELCRIINGYIAFLKQSKRGADEPGSTLAVHESSSDYLVENPEGPEDLKS